MTSEGKQASDVCIFFSIVVLRRKKESSAAQTETSKTDQKLEQVHYSTGGGGMELNQNAAYETMKYPEEVIYEQAT